MGKGGTELLRRSALMLIALATQAQRLPAVEAPPVGRRYEWERPGQLVHVDIKQLGRISVLGAGHRMVGHRKSQIQARVDGVLVAFTAEVRRGGRPLIERHVTTLVVNPSIDAALFKRPRS